MSKRRREAPLVEQAQQAKRSEVASLVEAEIWLAFQAVEARRQAAETLERTTDRAWEAAEGAEAKAKADQRLRVLLKLQEIIRASRPSEAVTAEQLDGSAWGEALAWVDEQLGKARELIAEGEQRGEGDRLAVRRASILRSLRDLVVQQARSEAEQLGDLLRGLQQAADPEGSLLRALRSSAGETGASLAADHVETILQAVRAQRKRTKQRSLSAIVAKICVEWLELQQATKKGPRR